MKKIDEFKALVERTLDVETRVGEVAERRATLEIVTPSGRVVGRLHLWMTDDGWRIGSTSQLLPDDWQTLIDLGS